MSVVIDRERALYREMWQHDAYAAHAPGANVLPLFLQMAGPRGAAGEHTVLDAGCGSGKGSLALIEAGFVVTACDIVDARVPAAQHVRFIASNLWDRLSVRVGFHDYVYCTDVLEHIPTEFVALVLERLLSVARRGVFLHIALTPDRFGAFVGQPLHLSVFPFVWWRDRMAEVGELVECRDLVSSAVYFVRPRLEAQ